MFPFKIVIINRFPFRLNGSYLYILCFFYSIKNIPSDHCVVIGCNSTYTDKHTLRHRFPKHKETSDMWVQKSNNNTLFNKSVELIFKTYVMCGKHFEDSCKSPGFKKTHYRFYSYYNYTIKSCISSIQPLFTLFSQPFNVIIYAIIMFSYFSMFPYIISNLSRKLFSSYLLQKKNSIIITLYIKYISRYVDLIY